MSRCYKGPTTNLIQNSHVIIVIALILEIPKAACQFHDNESTMQRRTKQKCIEVQRNGRLAPEPSRTFYSIYMLYLASTYYLGCSSTPWRCHGAFYLPSARHQHETRKPTENHRPSATLALVALLILLFTLFHVHLCPSFFSFFFVARWFRCTRTTIVNETGKSLGSRRTLEKSRGHSVSGSIIRAFNDVFW